MPDGEAPGWSVQDVERLRTTLGAFSDLDDPQVFRQVRVLMGRQLGEGPGPFPVPAYNDPRSQIAALVDVMDRHQDPERALRALADTLGYLRSEEAAMAELDELVEELAPSGRLPRSRLRAVAAELDALRAIVPPAVASGALDRALLPGEPSGLRGSETVSGMLLRLNDAREPAGGRAAAEGPLVLRFLAELAAALPGEPAELLRSHLVLAGRELGLAVDVRNALAARCRPAAGRVPHPPGRRVLQIRLSETSPGKQEYEVDATLFDWTDDGLRRPRKREAEQPYSLGDLQQLGHTCLIQWEDLAARLDRAHSVRVEFLLPWSLLDHPVERWLTDTQGYLLGHKYPVVIRSLDRMRQQSWHRDWQRRWQAFNHPDAPGPPEQGVGWLALEATASLDGGGHGADILRLRGREGEVRAWLDTRPDSAGLALAFAYDHRDPRRAGALREAVCEGVPFMVWRRDGGNPAELAERLREPARQRFADLPAVLRLWRRSASRDDAADMHNHLTLLWDDPHCVPPESVLTAPAPEGKA
ncbi:hypothetical protein DEJ50_08420 [Streptomyces venezuelae]|uniref:Uncharacterized protein n=1 Tax=Streptomyces venezuelae TaxID=54571 RepID=A0A5P2CZX4_STRVZ|nr:hypothetical protein [Streptomyces venezuelae]QES47830.1 hypothetical protein DEJ50_08420 [Streptomyces venezuelae]